MSSDILRELGELRAQQKRTAELIAALVREWRKNAVDTAARAQERQMLAEMTSAARNTADALATLFSERERDGEEDILIDGRRIGA